MKRAIRIRNGEKKTRPTIPKRMANPLPTSAAIFVARWSGIRFARNARSTLPPSIGKRGEEVEGKQDDIEDAEVAEDEDEDTGCCS